MTAADENVRSVDHAREARYAEAMARDWNEQVQAISEGGEFSIALTPVNTMAVADAERAAEREQDAATIAELRAQVERLRAQRDELDDLIDEINAERGDADSLGEALAREVCRAEAAEERLRAVEAQFEGWLAARRFWDRPQDIEAFVRAALAPATSSAEQEGDQ